MQTTAIDADRHFGTATAGRATDVYSKVTWRLVPLLFVCYVLSYLDRINVLQFKPIMLTFVSS